MNKYETWIVVSRETGKIITETADVKLVERINRELYHVFTAKDWLRQDLDRILYGPIDYEFSFK